MFLVSPVRSYIRYAPMAFAKAPLWMSVAARCRWLGKRVDARTTFGARMTVDTQDTVGEYIYYFGTWEPALSHWIASRLCPGDVFVDVGANVGYFSLLGAQLVGDSGCVVAIEPAPQIFSLLEKNVRRNAAKNVRCAQIAVWDREERLKLFTKPAESAGQSTVVPEWATRCGLDFHYEVQGLPFDRILTPAESAAVRIIKIDVEGAEWQVLEGLVPLLNNFRPDLEIVVEVTHDSDRVLQTLRQQGFYCYQVENEYSGLSYLSRQSPAPPKRVDRLSSTYSDLIFSRVDSPELGGIGSRDEAGSLSEPGYAARAPHQHRAG